MQCRDREKKAQLILRQNAFHALIFVVNSTKKISKCAAVFDYIQSRQFVQVNGLGVGAKRTRGQQKCFSDQSAMN